LPAEAVDEPGAVFDVELVFAPVLGEVVFAPYG
jgi:hypothetical protein